MEASSETALCSQSRAITTEESPSYPEVTRKLLGRWAGLLLEVAIVAFGIGMVSASGVLKELIAKLCFCFVL